MKQFLKFLTKIKSFWKFYQNYGYDGETVEFIIENYQDVLQNRTKIMSKPTYYASEVIKQIDEWYYEEYEPFRIWRTDNKFENRIEFSVEYGDLINSDELMNVVAKKERDCQISEYQNRAEKDKTELERAKNTINQIDYILEKLFDVRHDTVDKQDEFEKILSDRVKENVTDFLPTEPIKVADMLINAEGEYEHNQVVKAISGNEKGTYRIFDVSELRQIAEHLFVYCNHNREVEE